MSEDLDKKPCKFSIANIEIIRDLIKSSNIKVGDSFHSMNDLCRHIGIVPASATNTRKAISRELKRWFSFTTFDHSNKLTISDTYYKHPHEKLDFRIGCHNTATNLPIQYLLLFNKDLYDSRAFGFTKTEILIKIGLLNDFPIDNEENNHDLFLFYEKYIHLLYRYLQSAFTQLEKKHYVNVYDYYYNNTTEKSLSDKEKATYLQISNDVLEILRCKNIQEVYSTNQIDRYWRIRKMLILKHFGGNTIVHVYHLSRTAVCLDNYKTFLKECLLLCDPNKELHLDYDAPGEKEKFYVTKLPISMFWDAMKKNYSHKKLGKGGKQKYLRYIDLIQNSNPFPIEKTIRGENIPSSLRDAAKKQADKILEERFNKESEFEIKSHKLTVNKKQKKIKIDDVIEEIAKDDLEKFLERLGKSIKKTKTNNKL